MADPLTANDVLKNIDVISNSLVIQHFNVTVSVSATSMPEISVDSTLTDQNGNPLNDYLGNAPLLLHSLAILYGSSFTGYSIYVKLKGLNIDNNQFNQPAGNTSGFDYVPTGKKYLIPPNERMNIYAFNSNGATANGSFNVLAIFQKLDNMTPAEQAQLY